MRSYAATEVSSFEHPFPLLRSIWSLPYRLRAVGFGGAIRTPVGSYPSAAMQLNPTFEYHRCPLLIRLRCLYFAFHVAAVLSFTTLISLLHLTVVRLVIEHCPRSHTATLGFVVSPNLFFFFVTIVFFLTSIYTIVIFSLGDGISPFYSRSNRQFAVQIEISCVNMSNVSPCTVDIDIGYANA